MKKILILVTLFASGIASAALAEVLDCGTPESPIPLLSNIIKSPNSYWVDFRTNDTTFLISENNGKEPAKNQKMDQLKRDGYVLYSLGDVEIISNASGVFLSEIQDIYGSTYISECK